MKLRPAFSPLRSQVLCDEPTSGLDSAAAAAVLGAVSELARARRIAVLCTIHQPSSRLWSSFDEV